jgi:hypothetical protein
VPYEARQPSVSDAYLKWCQFTQSGSLWQMRERNPLLLCLSAHLQEGFYFALFRKMLKVIVRKLYSKKEFIARA